MSYSDRDAYDAMISALASSRAFATVRLDDPTRGAAGAPASPSAVVVPGPWEDTTTDSAETTLRRVTYRVAIAVRGGDARSRFREADRLAGLAMALLDGASFGGGCIPALSRLEWGECRPSGGDGEATCELRGTFSYLTPASMGYMTSRLVDLSTADIALVGAANSFTRPQAILATLGVGTAAPAGQAHVVSADPARPALVVDGAAGQSAGALLVRSGAGTVNLAVRATGELGVGTATPAAQAHVVSGDPARPALLIDGAASQSAGAVQVRTNGGAVGLTVLAGGELGIGTTPSSPLHVASGRYATTIDASQTHADPGTVSRIAARFSTSGAGGAGVFNYATFHSASGAKNNRCIFAQATSTSGGPDVNIAVYALADGASVQNSAVFAQGGTDPVDFAILAINRTALRTQNAGIPALEVRGVANMTAPLISVQNPSGTVVSGVLGNGAFQPPTIADAAASNNSIYFSSTLSKLVYKDAAGTVFPLY